MPDSSPAVFLSYASQDAEAAARIAEALRAIGIAVWFDVEGGLEQGDEWDAKIKQQIKDCVLFIPIVSANTEARHEGYFRIEWELAAQRALGIASGIPFILPVVIDGTPEQTALVPDRFKAVQWTKLPGGEVSEKVQGRFFQLWQRRTGSVHSTHTPAPTTAIKGNSAPSLAPAAASKLTRILLPAVLTFLGIAALAIWQPWQNSDSEQPDRAELAEPATSNAALSEARQLVDQAWILLSRPEMARAELDAADTLCQRAAALDPNDAEVWAVWSQVDSWYVYHRLERTSARQDGARTKAARALSLAPLAYEARLAQACYLVREGGGQGVVYDLEEAKELLLALLREKPDEPRALLALGILHRNSRNVAGYRDAFSRAAKSPNFAVQAFNELGWAELFNGNNREAEAAADASIQLQPYWANLNLKTNLLAYWWGDLEGAQATQDRISGPNRLEDYSAATILGVEYFRRDPDGMLRVINRLSRDWLESNAFVGPVAWWNGLARQMAGQAEAASLQWRIALQGVEEQLSGQRDSSYLLRWKARLLLASGDTVAGATALRLAREMGSREYFSVEALDEILLGRKEDAITVLEERVKVQEVYLTAAFLRLSPQFDPLRDQPRFQALLARMEADPRFSPTAMQTGDLPTTHSSLPAPAGAIAPDKSIAVLAFENRSADANNAYFSDGISEELLNVLTRVEGLKVTARTSAFHFKGKNIPIPDIGRQLGVAYVVEGSVRRAGDRVRITAQLIKADDGFNIWSQTFDRELKDIFALQDEIAGLVAQELQLKLGVTSPEREVNPEAYSLYLEARHLWNQRGEDNFIRAEAALNRALELDPGFAEAHATMADIWAMRATYWSYEGKADTSEEIAHTRDWANHALSLNPDLSRPYSALGWACMLEGKWEESRRWHLRAMERSPRDATTRFWYGSLLGQIGELAESEKEIRIAAELDPLSFIITLNLAFSPYIRQDWEECYSYYQKGAELREGGFVPGLAGMAHSAFRLGRTEEAVRLSREVLASWPELPRFSADQFAVWVLHQTGHETEAEAFVDRILPEIPPRSYLRGFLLAAVGRWEDALPNFETTPYTARGWVFDSPILDPWREDPRFVAMIDRWGETERYHKFRAAMRDFQENKA